MTTRLIALCLGLLTLGPLPAFGCGVPGDDNDDREPDLTDLVGSLDPLQEWFDAHAEQPRALLILSPV